MKTMNPAQQRSRRTPSRSSGPQPRLRQTFQTFLVFHFASVTWYHQMNSLTAETMIATINKNHLTKK